MNSLILLTADDTRRARLRTFEDAAAELQSLWPGSQVVRVCDGATMLAAIENRVGPLGRLAIVGHGGTDWLLHSRRGLRIKGNSPPQTISVQRFADAVAKVASDNIHIALCACNTASRTGHNRWSWKSYGPGGAGGLADVLYWRLAERARNATVIGHSAPGHTTRNVAKRVWRGDLHGASVMDLVMGDDAHRVARNRAQWREWLEVKVDGHDRATLLMAGAIRVP